jgi:hypothetical protein
MTSDEAAAVDLPGRMAFVGAVKETRTVLTWLLAIPSTVAGAVT